MAQPGRYYNSGDVECQSEFVRYADLFDQQLKPGPQVRDRLFLRCAIADSADARPEQGRGAPNAVLILLDRIGHVNDTSHVNEYRTSSRPVKFGLRNGISPPETRVGTSRDVLSYSRRKEHVKPRKTSQELKCQAAAED